MQRPGVDKRIRGKEATNLTDPKQNIVQPMDKPEDDISMKKNSQIVLVVYGLLIVLGLGTGFLLSRNNSVTSSAGATPTTVKNGNTVGSTDTKTFKDTATGVIQKGGSGGEGTHQLIRDGGPSQTVYLVSSVVDLDQYVGKKVNVWGQTMAAQKVAWLMDVGKIELLSK